MLDTKVDKNNYEATVLAVDIKRGVCKCRTLRGHIISNVGWSRALGQMGESGQNYAPRPKETVNISIIEGKPEITSSKGIISYGSTIRSRISPNSLDDYFEDDYNLSVLSKVMRSGGSMPEDQVPGDFTHTNDRGGVVGLLRSGSWLAKASPLAQIFLSRIDDLARIVARNYEQFSDAVLKVQANAGGKIYEYTAWFRTPVSSKTGTPDYYEVIGDVAAGEAARDDYLNIDVSSASGTLVKKQVVPNHYEHTLDIDGSSVRKVYDGESSSTESISSDTVVITVTSGGSTSVFSISPSEVKIKSGDKLSVIVEGDADVTVEGNETRTIKGDATEIITGNKTVQVAGNTTVQVAGTVMETSVGAWTIAGNPTILP